MFSLVIETSDALQVVDLAGTAYVLGRAADCDICIKDNRISRRHAFLSRSGDAWTITDSGSASGTWVNRQRVRSHQLAPGDVIVVGSVVVRFREAEPVSEEELAIVRSVKQGDEAARAVYGDWLESRGLPLSAQYVRAEDAYAHSKSEQHRAELRALSSQVDARRRALVARTPVDACGSRDCPREWDKLELTPNARERSCPACRRVVTFCDDLREARQLALERQPVAIEPARERLPDDLRATPQP